MKPPDFEQLEELLVGLMADYDEALAADASTAALDNTTADFDPLLAAEWAGIKECLELLDRARRSGIAGSGEQGARSRGTLLHAPSSVLPASSPRRLGRFVLERELGRGGLGIVYLAHDAQLGRKVALKVPQFQALLDDDLRRRFLREAEAAARLSHPNLVTVYEVGEDNAICYLASEYCPGPTLAQWLRAQQSSVAPAEAATIVLALAGGVDHAHSRGVLHRDIKPSNVMMTEEGAGFGAESVGPRAEGKSVFCSPLSALRSSLLHRWTPKLTDFGMAKLLEHDGGDRTRTGAVIGTLAYMTPEQVEGETASCDARTDIYALGAILYELLTLTPPYGGQSDVERLRKLFASEPLTPRKLRRDIPRDLEAIALKCLAHDPKQRYATADQLEADLRRFLDGRPTVARPLAVSARLVKWTRRRPAIAALCVVSLLAASLVLAINARRIEESGRLLEESSQLRILANQGRQRALVEEAFKSRLLYASRMRKAQQAWRDGDPRIMHEMLMYYADRTPDAGLRHFEWYHLNYLANLPHRILRGHAGRVYSVAYSPDGQFIVSGGADGTVRLWDATSGKVEAVLHEHQSDISSLVFSSDGDTFATSSGDKTVKLWSLSQRKPVATLPHPFPVDACAFFAGGKLLGSLSSETDGLRKSLLWDVPSRTLQPAWPPPDEKFQAVIAGQSGRTAVVFVKNFATVWHRQEDTWTQSRRIDVVDPRHGATLSPDEEYLLVTVWPRYVHIYRLRDGVLVNVLKDHGAGVNCIAFSPRADQIATSSDDTSVCVFEFPSGKLLHRFFGHEGGSVWHVAWSPAGDSLASVGNDGAVRVWDINHGSSRQHLSLPEPRSRASRGRWGFSLLQETGLCGFAFLQDGESLNCVYLDGLNLVWNLTTGRLSSRDQVARPIALAPAPASITPFPETAQALVAQWDPRAYSIPNRIGGASSPSTTATTATTTDCTRIVRGGSQIMHIDRGHLQVWNTESWKRIETRRLNQFETVEFVFDISADGERMCGADDDGHVYVCDLTVGAAVDLGSFVRPTAAYFSPDGDRVLLWAAGEIREYDIDQSSWTRKFNADGATAVRYSADTQRIAVAFESGHVCIYDVLTGEETLRLEVRGSEILFSSDGRSLITDGAPDGGLYLWPGKKETVP